MKNCKLHKGEDDECELPSILDILEQQKRAIKFRAWDNREKFMIGWLKVLKDRSYFGYHFEMIDFENVQYTWMQFTGLVDKNGKEIYEGDIVDLEITDICDGEGCCHKYIRGNCGCSGHMRRIVKFENGTFYVNPHGANSHVKVVGNIYENPELL